MKLLRNTARHRATTACLMTQLTVKTPCGVSRQPSLKDRPASGKSPLSSTLAGGGGSPFPVVPLPRPPWYRRRRPVCACITVALLAAIAAAVVLLMPSEEQSNPRVFSEELRLPPKDVPLDPQFLLPNGKQIIRRSEWSSVAPDYVRPLSHPTPYMVIGHTAGAACAGLVDCAEHLRNYRDEQRTRWDQPDITYNFLVDRVGNVYEGRGWDATNANKAFVLRCNLHVALMGNFVDAEVPSEMERAVRELLDLGVRLGKLSADYRLLAHSQVSATLSPGRKALDVISSWPHRCLDDCDDGVQCVYQDHNSSNLTSTTVAVDVLLSNS